MAAEDTPSFQHRLVRQVLLGPALVRRAAASQARNDEERWMLKQAKDVRASYVRDVLDAGDDDRLQEIWMLRQPKSVRESYVREILEEAGGDRLQEAWMLRQADEVRESFIREVLERRS